MTRLQKEIVEKLLAKPDEWHYFADDRATVETVCAISNLGILTISEDNEHIRLKCKEKAERFLGWFADDCN